jgi:hypothetical protein
VAGIDEYTVLMLHMQGANNKTSFPDASYVNPKTATVGGTVCTSAAEATLGQSSSGYFDGSGGDFLAIASSSDFGYSGDFTIDFWVYFTAITNCQFIASQTSNGELNFFYYGGQLYIGRTGIANVGALPWNPLTNQWYHLAAVRYIATDYIFVNGICLGTFPDSSVYPAGAIGIGNYASVFPVTGYMQEFRISNGIARWTSDFTPPTVPYSIASTGIEPAGIPSPAAIGAPRIIRYTTCPAGIPTPGAVGSPALFSSIKPAGIPSSGVVGAPRISIALQSPAGIPSPGAVGAPTITLGTTTIPPTGYSDNLLTNPSAETGDLTGWTAAGVSVVAGGTQGNYCFQFDENAGMSQTLGSQSSPAVFEAMADFLPAVPWTSMDVAMDAYLEITITYSDGSQDVFNVPARSYTTTGSWYNINSTITADDTKTVSSVTVAAITAGRAGQFDNLSFEKQISGAVQLGVDYGGTTISPLTGLTQTGQNSAVIADQYGLNPNFVMCYPNKCANSSFENFDSETLLPAYWDTSGCVSDDSSFVGDYSLKLAPGEYAVQSGTELADPAWWAWCERGTRIACQVKGTSQIMITVLQGGQPVPLSYMSGGQSVNVPKPYGWTVGCSSDWACADSAGTLTTAMRTCNVAASTTGGPIAIRFDNVGASTAYIDAVQIGPDWTGEWPGVYVDGPESEPNEVDLVPQLFTAPYSASGVQFTLQTPVSQIFCSPNIQATTASAFTADSFQLICQPIRGTYQGQPAITGVWVYPEGPSVPTTAAGTAAGAAVTLIAFGKPVSLVHWYALNYDDSWWQAALEICTASQPMTFDGENLWAQPIGWVDGCAWWIWGVAPTDNVAPVGDNYFRKEFTLPVTTECTIDAVCDDGFTLYIDEIPILSGARKALLDIDPAIYPALNVRSIGGLFVPGVAWQDFENGVNSVNTGIAVVPGTIYAVSQSDIDWVQATYANRGGMLVNVPELNTTWECLFYILVDYDGTLYDLTRYRNGLWTPLSATISDWPSVLLERNVVNPYTDPTPDNHTYTLEIMTPTQVIQSVTLPLVAGDHIIAVKGSNDAGIAPNPAGLMVTVRNSSGRVVVHTDDSWKCLPYPNPAPT